jgi:hypothetical protein
MIKFFVFIIMVLGSPFFIVAQSTTNPKPGSLDIYSSIKAQEAKFPLPNTIDTIDVGTVVFGVESNTPMIFNYAVPIYNAGQYSEPNPDYGNGDDLVKSFKRPNTGADITVANILHVRLRFKINYTNQPNAKVTITVGGKPQTASAGKPALVFSDITSVATPLSISATGLKTFTTNNKPGKPNGSIRGIASIKITWNKLAVGAITIPALPVSLVYAMIVDKQKLNVSSITVSKTQHFTTSAVFLSGNSSNRPVPSSFQSSVDVSKGMKYLGDNLSKIPNVYTQVIGAILSGIGGNMGSSAATMQTSQYNIVGNSLDIATTSEIEQDVLVKNGGPGEGDLITYYSNAKVVWFSQNGKMTLALLSADALKTMSVAQLKDGLSYLKDKPKGSKDPNLLLNANTIKSLLLLDPFVANSSPKLDINRFVKITQEPLVPNGVYRHTFTQSIQRTDSRASIKTNLYVEDNSKGFMSALGIGVTEDNLLTIQMTQGLETESSDKTEITLKLTANNNGKENYAFDIYYDKVFGTFAFKRVRGV